ncbi:MAG: hypothetical protein F6K19_10550 [Cyanothece sp. SIO1E1]|nr:hypothetical protein [Cyanothece sp. SIO1E1]
MLYLAEIQKKTGFIGSGKAELKLLACQRSEQNWSAVSGDEVVPADEASTFNAGTLVMVELTASRQVQRIQEAGRQLVSILQNFSRLQEKFKTQEEEIEQWKQSLTYQSQELNRREMEIESRQEQLQEVEQDFERLEQQRQEIETSRTEIDSLRTELERKNQELEGAWAHLHGEMRKLEEQQADLQQNGGLDDEQTHRIQAALNRLSGAIAPTEAIREQLNFSFALIEQQQNALNHHWQQLEEKRTAAEQIQAEVEQQAQALEKRLQEWQQAEDGLIDTKVELQVQQQALRLQQEYTQAQTTKLQSQTELHQQMCQLAGTPEPIALDAKLDLEALENMPLEALQSTVQDLQRDLAKVSNFVSDQEEELKLQQEEIDQLRDKIQQASEYDRLSLETDLAEAEDCYQMLNKTLVGQRRNLQERENVFSQHQAVLNQRQGHPPDNSPNGEVDLSPVLTKMESLRQQQIDELQQFEAQLQQLQETIAQTQGTVDQCSGEQEARQHELKNLESECQSKRAIAAELWAQVNLYQETLQPMQDNLNGLKQKLEDISGLMSQFQEASDYQLQAISEMQQTIHSLSTNQPPELAAS